MAALRITLLVVLLAGVSYFAFRDPVLISSCEAPGTFDFIQYHTAYSILSEGQDPYDADTVLEVQRKTCGEKSFVVGMYNPPWILLYLAPVLELSFFNSALAWLVLNLLFLLFISFVVCRLLEPRITLHPLMAAAALLFAPVLHSLHMGQMSVLLCVFYLLFLAAERKGYFALGGLALTPLSIKPHLFYLVWVYLCWREIKERRWELLALVVLGTGASVALAEVLLPGGLGYWISHMQSPPEHFIGGTLIANLRHLAFTLTGDTAAWLLAAVPIGASVLFLLLLSRKGDMVNSMDAWCRLTCLSVWTSPYGWSFDYSLLLPFQLLMVKDLILARSGTELLRSPTLWLLGIANIALVCQGHFGFDGYHHATWFPPMMLVIWELHRRCAAGTER